MSRAGVYSIAALEQLRTALAVFADEARDALVAVDLESKRMLDWVADEQMKHWKLETRRREEAVVHAKADLDRCKIAAAFGRTPDCTDQKVALRRAKAHLGDAQDKLAATRHWGRVVEQEIADARGSVQQLDNMLAADVQRALAELDRMVTALQAYAEIGAPKATPGGRGEPADMRVESAAGRPAGQGEEKTGHAGQDAAGAGRAADAAGMAAGGKGHRSQGAS